MSHDLAVSTKDAAYRAVAPDDFASMLNIERHATRASDFDRMIAATHEHYWNPLDRKYLNFETPFDMENVPLVPEEFVPGLTTPYVSDHLSDRKVRVRFINESVRRMFSSILHGEQGALNLSASLCHVLVEPSAQEYAANQTREEARHVTAFAHYIRARWGTPTECNPTLRSLLEEIVATPHVYKKIVGMQLMVEGLAMGALSNFYNNLSDPLGRRVVQLVMADEAFHHKFGKMWAKRTIPHLTTREHVVVEYWAAECFQKLMFNLAGPQEQKPLYAAFGLDPDRVLAESQAMWTDDMLRAELHQSTSMFRGLAKTLLKAGIITHRTRSLYNAYIDMDELSLEGDDVVGQNIALAGVRYLQEINMAPTAELPDGSGDDIAAPPQSPMNGNRPYTDA